MGFVESPHQEYQPHQIVFLECGGKRLYAEVIQTVIDRRLCWARPLAIVTQPFGDRHFAMEISLEKLLDLRQASDLLLPLSWFRLAVDTEVIPVLAQLSELKPESAAASAGAETLSRLSVQEQLQQFIRALCHLSQDRSDSFP